MVQDPPPALSSYRSSGSLKYDCCMPRMRRSMDIVGWATVISAVVGVAGYFAVRSGAFATVPACRSAQGL